MSFSKVLAIATDRFRGDVIVTFSDQRAAVFSAAFLYASLPHAEEIFASEFGDEQIYEQ
jgi:hypothetical protein